VTETIAASAQDAPPSLLIREATPADDAQICAQILRNAMPGRISLAASHDPSFFASAQVEGYIRRVSVAERDGRIVGMGLMAKRRVFLNGIPAEVGYTSSLRTDPSIRGGTAVARGSRLMKQWHEEDLHAPFYLCCIIKDNVLARRILTSGRAGMPAAHEIGTMYVASIPLLHRPRTRPPDGLRIVRGGAVGAEAIIECLSNHGRSKQFFPVYTIEDLLEQDGILRGLHVNDFHVAISGDRVVGVVACWNQLAFRRMVVAGYSGGMRLVRSLLSPIARMLGLAPLPNPGDAVQSVSAACIAIEDNEPGVFRALLDSVLQAEHGTGKTFLTVGLMEQDPLSEVTRRYLHLPTRSCIYALQWGGVGAAAELDGRLPYVELGSL
jgi:hypothetical protein